MLEQLKEQVCAANKMLPQYGLVSFTWGNVSGIDRDSGLIVIKPSGVEYAEMTPEDMCVVDLAGNRAEGRLRPSSDTPTHIELYRSFPNIGGVVHTHSRWASSFAQAHMKLTAYGTTHADYFYGDIPCTRELHDEEIAGNYEEATGRVIAETFSQLDSDAIPGVLVAGHGPFVWGASPLQAVHNAAILEEIAFMNYHTLEINPEVGGIGSALLTKHYSRKHGSKAYYGQP